MLSQINEWSSNPVILNSKIINGLDKIKLRPWYCLIQADNNYTEWKNHQVGE